MKNIIIEQTNDYPRRMKYDPESDSFHETEYGSLAYARGVTFPYGWLKESGTPPDEHLDVILVTRKQLQLGDELPVRVIGVFKRYDHDHKLVAVPVERDEVELSQLTEGEQDELYRLYPKVDETAGEGWFGSRIAQEVIDAFYKDGRKVGTPS